MRRLRYFLLAVTLVAPPTPAQDSAAPARQTIAEKMWSTLQAVPWSAPYEDWASSHLGTTCAKFHGDGAWRYADEDWSYRCQRATKTDFAEWSFYALQYNETPSCRLEQFRTYASGLLRSALEEVHAQLLSRLNSVYGPGQDPGRFLGEFGSAYWRKVRRWQTGVFQIYLYFDEYQHDEPKLVLLARHRPLSDALQEDDRLAHSEPNRWVAPSDSPLNRKLTEELRASFPQLAGMLAEDPAAQLKESKQKEIVNTLFNLLESTDSASPDRKPALLLATDRVAERVEFPAPKASGKKELREELERRGLSYGWSPLGATWVYHHDLLWQVSRNYSATDWGEIAFLVLLNMGWDTSAGCGNGSDQFRDVIRYGEEFLAQHPQSPYRVDVLLVLGEAYETWWSLSQASDRDDYVSAAAYQAGAEGARRTAIADYQQVLKLSTGSDRAAYARWRLPRLMLGLDTNQRRFFCVYD